MKMSKCILISLLCLGLLSSLACSEKNDTPNKIDTNVTTALSQSETIAETELSDELPETNYNGEKLTILVNQWSKPDISSEDEKADTVMNDVVALRNQKIEERFNVDLDIFEVADPTGCAAKFRTTVRAGDGSYDIFLNTQLFSVADATEGLLVNWKDLPNINLTKPWWDKGVFDVCFGENVYFAAGDITYSTAGYTSMLLFNKDMFKDMDYEYPYQLVRDGKWTYDEFIKLCTDVKTDLDGDGKFDIKKDRYSVSGWQYETCYNFFRSLGGTEIIKNAEGMPEVSIFSPRSVSAFEKVLDIFTKYGGHYNSKEYTYEQRVFEEGRLLFLDTRAFEIKELREMQNNFGIIPHPKYDEKDPYTQLINNNVATMTTVPVTNTRLEMTSSIIEALAAEGYKSITPSYFEVVLRTKLTRDDESADMLDIIWKSRTYKYTIDAHEGIMMGLFNKDNYNLVSTYEKRATKAAKDIEKIVSVFGIK